MVVSQVIGVLDVRPVADVVGMVALLLELGIGGVDVAVRGEEDQGAVVALTDRDGRSWTGPSSPRAMTGSKASGSGAWRGGR